MILSAYDDLQPQCVKKGLVVRETVVLRRCRESERHYHRKVTTELNHFLYRIGISVVDPFFYFSAILILGSRLVVFLVPPQ